MPTDADLLRASGRVLGRWNPLAGLHPPQVAFARDPAKRKAALCTRRAGKTTAASRMLLKAALDRPGTISVYITETRKVAKRLLWDELKRCHADHTLGIVFNETDLEARLPNGSQIWLTGAKDEGEISKLRGPKYALVILDESASFRAHMEKLVREVIGPALMDLGGTLVLTGTPGPRFEGLFYDVTCPTSPKYAKGWSLHRWTWRDNPSLPDPENHVRLEMENNGWTHQSPGYLREYEGKWVRLDGELLVNGYSPERNDVNALPAHVTDWHYLLAIDPGARVRTGFVVGAYSPQVPDLYLVHAEGLSHQGTLLSVVPDEIAAQAKLLKERFDPERVIMDCGGLGQSFAEEFQQVYGLQVEATDKSQRLTALEFFNGDLRAGRVKVLPQASEMVEEWSTVRADPKTRWAEPGVRIDLLVAGLYLHRSSRHYWFQPPVLEPAVGSTGWERQLVERLVEQQQGERQGLEDAW